MEFYNGKLCMTYSELREVVSNTMIRKCVREGSIKSQRRPCNSTPALYAVDELPPQYKNEIYRRNPDIKQQAKCLDIMETVGQDGAAIEFFANYRLEDGRFLNYDKQCEYCNNAAILNALGKIMDQSNSHRQKQGHPKLKKAEFWQRAAEAMTEMAKSLPHSLPENHRRLQEKFDKYIGQGYGALVSGKFRNRNAAKIAGTQQENLLIKLLADHRNLDNSQVAKIYNYIAQAKKWPGITGRSIGYYRKKFALVCSAGRLGKAGFENRIAM